MILYVRAKTSEEAGSFSWFECWYCYTVKMKEPQKIQKSNLIQCTLDCIESRTYRFKQKFWTSEFYLFMNFLLSMHQDKYSIQFPGPVTS